MMPPRERTVHRERAVHLDVLRAKLAWGAGPNRGRWPTDGEDAIGHWLAAGAKRDREQAPPLGDAETLTASEVHHLPSCSPNPCAAFLRSLLAPAQTKAQTARSFGRGRPEASADLVSTARALRPTGAGPRTGPAASAGTCIWR